ncbi:MAG: transposase [Tannerellaceae bacterium]|nr:transposase [Tannerellaceae bacterium]
MQGSKTYQEKLFLSFRLSERVPEDNFYRRLGETLDLSFVRKMTRHYYGKEGKKSIDPEVFFKFMLIGYIENINSDRKIIAQASMRLDMLFFLGYDIDEELPWHSTLSRTRKLFGEEVFLELFRTILRMCIERGMLWGKRQAVDSAFVKANASLSSLVEKELCEESSTYYNSLLENEASDPGNALKHSDKFISQSDPDARVSQKPGKVPQLNYLAQISVDTASHVICGAMADFADKKDSDCTAAILGQTIINLKKNGMKVEEVLADTGYSSAISLKYLEDQNIEAYIPAHAAYKPYREGFTYNAEEDCYICREGKKLVFTRIKWDNTRKTSSRNYATRRQDCQDCPFKSGCADKRGIKTITDSSTKEYYDRTYQRTNTPKGKRMMRLRSSTVEPVLGTLLNFGAMKKVYTKGMSLARKHVLMAAAVYNLKKLMAYKTIKSVAWLMQNIALSLNELVWSLIFMLHQAIWYQFKGKLETISLKV